MIDGGDASVNKQVLKVYVMSDSSGETAAHVVHAAVVQFAPELTKVSRLPQIRSAEQIRSQLKDLAGKNVLVAYTLVLPEYRETVEQEANAQGIASIDLLGPLMGRLSELTGAAPLSQPGRSHLLDDAYFQRMEAVNFTVRFDDGKNQESLRQADVILTGLSRTSKTPNCMYLAQHYGLKAANVPIVPGVQPPRALFSLPSNKVIGLTIDPVILHRYRVSRAKILGLESDSGYANIEDIRQEVQYAKSIFRDLRCHMIDVSAKAIEETSSEISLYLSQQRNEGFSPSY
ncbi:MAG: phosphoenolpyruvate synthase regulatory protein [Proteobacteria bacterium]|nr:MAG: phosphoenolpyruvate synthase regulatory protein [Pseudomonadota bacterium]